MGRQSHLQARGRVHPTAPLPLGWGYGCAHPDTGPRACRAPCPELTAARACTKHGHNVTPSPSNRSSGKTIKQKSAAWYEQVSPPSAESYSFLAPFCSPAWNLFRLSQTTDCSNSYKQVYTESKAKSGLCAYIFFILSILYTSYIFIYFIYAYMCVCVYIPVANVRSIDL